MTPYSSVGRNILVIDKYMKLYLKNALKPYDLNTAEGMVLLTLYGHNGLAQDEIMNELHGGEWGRTQDQLIDELHYDKGVMTRTMQALEAKGYVNRQGNSADGRSYLFYLSKKAEEFKPRLMSILRAWNDGVLKGFDVQQIEQMERVLAQMADNARLIK